MKTSALSIAICVANLITVGCGEETVCERLQQCCEAIARESLRTNEPYYACGQLASSEESCGEELRLAAQETANNPGAPPFPEECSL
ncbi:MAG: hypothetical protein KTR25_03040 [Myxococcales bacterium]|nr:hypothetical protein [Myxococcales bacterium]